MSIRKNKRGRPIIYLFCPQELINKDGLEKKNYLTTESTEVTEKAFIF